MTQEIVPYSEDFIARVRKFKKQIHEFYKEVGEQPTPEFDGEGRPIIRKREDGMNYIIESYMRKKLDEIFPGWSWEMAAPLQFLGAEWVVAQGHLTIIDEHLLAFNIVPPVRRFYGVDAVRIQYRKDAPHTPENIVDIGDNCKAAVMNAFKFAVNRLTFIGDDVYGKRILEEGAGSIDEVIKSTENGALQQKLFFEYLKKKNVTSYGALLKRLGVSSLSEVSDWKLAYEVAKELFERG
jgi:hypothetical protein